jgi:two-component system response regulator
LIDDFAFSAIEEPIRPGDRFLFFTDGVFEAASPSGDEFGLERLGDALARHRTSSLDSMLTQLLADVQEHCAHVPFGDDVCMVGVELETPRPEKS